MNALFCSKCESEKFDFVECRGGMTFWKCVGCNEIEYDFNDTCNGG